MTDDPLQSVYRFTVSDDDSGERLDMFLAQRLNATRSQVRRLLGQDAVRVEGWRVRERDKGKLVDAGAVVEVTGFTTPQAMVIIPQADLPLTILAQGEGWLVVDKPAGVPVHPLQENETDTVLNAVAARFPQIQGVGEGGLRSGVVHRLDIETSGVLLFATTQEKWTELRAAFEEHRTRKIYRAIVAGRMEGDAREVMNLVVSQHKPAKVRVVNPTRRQESTGERRCDLTWKSLESSDACSLLEVQLGTGFLHQIRVMLAHLGHPVLGDKIYGPADANVPRLMLHASNLEIDNLRATSPDPVEFAACMAAIDK